MRIGFKPTGKYSAIVTIKEEGKKPEVYDATDCCLLSEGKMLLGLRNGKEIVLEFESI